ncbi:MAG TPA: hypothetical protein VFV75_03120 [Candidatus Polarisedimenticolaceae bacterium]|nr:hypothetical protein [Candidatus Polarisedimenticolaceae bacterium]
MTTGGDLVAALRSAVPMLRLPGRNATKADVLQYEMDGRRLAVKDYSARPRWIRNTLGRWLVRREVAAYRAAAGLPEVPALVTRLSPHAFATAWVEGRPLSALSRRPLDPGVFDRLDRALAALHARGIALGDLHHRDVLVTEEGRVHVVDFATSWLAPPGSGALRQAIFRRMAEQDLLAAARLRARFTGVDEAQVLAGLPPAAVRRWRRGRAVKRWLDRLRH